MALHEGSSEAAREYPEAEYITQDAQPTSATPVAVGTSVALLLIGAIVMWILRKKTIR
jgi:hypothetical protein